MKTSNGEKSPGHLTANANFSCSFSCGRLFRHVVDLEDEKDVHLEAIQQNPFHDDSEKRERGRVADDGEDISYFKRLRILSPSAPARSDGPTSSKALPIILSDSGIAPILNESFVCEDRDILSGNSQQQNLEKREETKDDGNPSNQLLLGGHRPYFGNQATLNQDQDDVSADQEVHQVVFTTLGELISAKRIIVTARSTQWLGQMSNAALQQLLASRQL